MSTPFDEMCKGAVCVVFIVAGISLCNTLWDFPSHPEVWTDEGTDCEYIHTMTGITPRLNSMGLPSSVNSQGDQQSERLFMKNEYLFGNEARCVAGYSFPWLIVGSNGTVA